ncbi:hypothetical protein BDN70DRAFT_892948 [Pholiota conissans]|uniref:Uncharacterized protein n=1 Tax=Pholiota conissans TaxID=109636 RepID=A0A9P6CVM0_9AGAR|nr:hypothetical protein BDN70DRAFT_892948 [Pholiota conissans]
MERMHGGDDSERRERAKTGVKMAKWISDIGGRVRWSRTHFYPSMTESERTKKICGYALNEVESERGMEDAREQPGNDGYRRRGWKRIRRTANAESTSGPDAGCSLEVGRLWSQSSARLMRAAYRTRLKLTHRARHVIVTITLNLVYRGCSVSDKIQLVIWRVLTMYEDNDCSVQSLSLRKRVEMGMKRDVCEVEEGAERV